MGLLSRLQIKTHSLQARVRKLSEPEGEWKTINGRHVLVGKGETPLDALNKSLAGNKGDDDKKRFAEIKKVLKSEMYDEVSHDKEGNVVIRRSFFYTRGKTAKDFQEKVQAVLDKAGVKPTNISSGEVWKPFKGGASIRNQSHWFVKIKP